MLLNLNLNINTAFLAIHCTFFTIVILIKILFVLMIILLFLCVYTIIQESRGDPLKELVVCYHITYFYIFIRVVLCTLFVVKYLVFNGIFIIITTPFEDYYFNQIDLNNFSTSSVEYCYNFISSNILYEIYVSIMPVVHADSSEDWSNKYYNHEFNTVKSVVSTINLNTNGAKLISDVLINLDNQIIHDFSLHILPHGIKAINILIDILNNLELSEYKDDKQLFNYINNQAFSKYIFHFDSSKTVLEPYVHYNVPLGNQEVPNAEDSGIYGFFYDNGDVKENGLGSAINCKTRLKSHLSNFYGNRSKSDAYIYSRIIELGNIKESLTWSPLITCDNIKSNWSISNSLINLSLGANKTIMAYTQFPLRIIEQAIIDKYEPTLNITVNKVLYYNFNFTQSDFTKSPDTITTYQAFNEDQTKVLAQAESLNQLAINIGISSRTVADKINWHESTSFIIDGKKVNGYLREVGAPIRTEPLSAALHAKYKLPPVDLGNRTLHDLIPGKLYAIHVDTLEDFGIYDSKRELYTALNPSIADKIISLSATENNAYVGTRVTEYINLARKNVTELGEFYYCRNPKSPAGQHLYIISLATGLCILYNSIHSIKGSYITIFRYAKSHRKHIINKDGKLLEYIYIYKDEFIKVFPEAEDIKEFTLTQTQLDSLSTHFPPKKQHSKLFLKIINNPLFIVQQFYLLCF